MKACFVSLALLALGCRSARDARPASVPEPLQRGFDAARAGRTGEANATFEALLKRAPDLPAAQFGLGWARQLRGGAGDLAEARALYEQAKPRLDGGADRELRYSVHHNLGLVYESEGKPDRAEAELRQALALEPGWSDEYLLARCLDDEKRWDDAIVLLDAALRVAPDRAQLHFERGRAELGRGNATHAGVELTEALRLDPSLRDAVTKLSAKP